MRAGDVLQTSAGRFVVVVAVRDFTATTVTYNLTVDGVHTYYVEAGTDPVLVHNCGDTWTSPQSLSDHVEEHGAQVGAQSEAEYEAGAAVIACDCDPSDSSVLRRFDSVTQTATYYDTTSGELVVKSPKGIVTYFKPDRGAAYFNDPERVVGNLVPVGEPIPWSADVSDPTPVEEE